jgi:hypothetical protein
VKNVPGRKTNVNDTWLTDRAGLCPKNDESAGKLDPHAQGRALETIPV